MALCSGPWARLTKCLCTCWSFWLAHAWSELAWPWMRHSTRCGVATVSRVITTFPTWGCQLEHWHPELLVRPAWKPGGSLGRLLRGARDHTDLKTGRLTLLTSALRQGRRVIATPRHLASPGVCLVPREPWGGKAGGSYCFAVSVRTWNPYCLSRRGYRRLRPALAHATVDRACPSQPETSALPSFCCCASGGHLP